METERAAARWGWLRAWRPVAVGDECDRGPVLARLHLARPRAGLAARPSLRSDAHTHTPYDARSVNNFKSNPASLTVESNEHPAPVHAVAVTAPRDV